MKRSLNPASPTLRSSNRAAKVRVLLPSSLGKGPPKQETGVGRLRRGRKRRQCSCHHQPGNTGTFENHPHCFLDCPLRDPWLPSDAHREAVLEGLISGHFYFFLYIQVITLQRRSSKKSGETPLSSTVWSSLCIDSEGWDRLQAPEYPIYLIRFYVVIWTRSIHQFSVHDQPQLLLLCATNLYWLLSCPGLPPPGEGALIGAGS